MFLRESEHVQHADLPHHVGAGKHTNTCMHVHDTQWRLQRSQRGGVASFDMKHEAPCQKMHLPGLAATGMIGHPAKRVKLKVCISFFLATLMAFSRTSSGSRST